MADFAFPQNAFYQLVVRNTLSGLFLLCWTEVKITHTFLVDGSDFLSSDYGRLTAWLTPGSLVIHIMM